LTSFLSWIDFSATEREQMRRAIALFQESDTRDELGIGTIRDAFSDALFPGTSTIQTRLRYFLFVPWIYQELERKRTTPEKVRARLRRRELNLITPLLEADDNTGTFGSSAKEGLKRLPSSVYWTGVRSWNICLFAGSQEQYHTSFNSVRRARRDAKRSRTDDEGVLPDRFDTWHPRLPKPPHDFPEEASFCLRREEAEFLQGRIVSSHRDSLLAVLATTGKPGSQVAFPWLSPEAQDAPPAVRQVLRLAKRFSFAIHGALHLYNVMLAQLAQLPVEEDHRKAIARWAEDDEQAEARKLEPDELWAFVAKTDANVPVGTREFVKQWLECLRTGAPGELVANDRARKLVRTRERRLKKRRSRFTNQRALDQWGGRSGSSRLGYRWGTVQSLLNDLHAGLHEDST
jgi:hypothetical protein